MPGIFNRAIFNDAIFNTAATSGAKYIGGGFIDLPTGRQRTKAELRREREKYGVIPEEAKKVIATVARREAYTPPQNAQHALKVALERRELIYRALYADMLREEIVRARNEEEEVALLLMLS